MIETTELQLFATFDETLGLSAFAEEVLAFAHARIADPVLKRIVRRDLAAVRTFSAKIHVCMTDMQAKSGDPLLVRRAEAIGTTCLPMNELSQDGWLAAWCSGSETALERCLEMAVASPLPNEIQKMFRKQLTRLLRRRARIESWITQQPPTDPVTDTTPPVAPHVLLVRFSATQGAAIEREFLLRNIPCRSANGPGEAMFRIVRRRPLMVLLSSAQVSDTKALREELAKGDPALPVISLAQETSPDAPAADVGRVLRAISDASARFARGRTN